MTTDGATGSLMFMTLGIVLLLAVVGLAWFWRKRSNRPDAAHQQAKREAAAEGREPRV
jgi:LPXTG-motif cell wall-anchored protein